jgi:hypothetical protein
MSLTQTEMPDRHQIIVARRESGEAFTAIARDFGISASRISQLYRKELIRRKNLNNPDPFYWLSVRAHNSLLNLGIYQKQQLELIGPGTVLSWIHRERGVPNFGRNSAKEIFEMMGWPWPY